MAIASQIKEMSGKSASVNDNANVFNKTIVFLVNKGDDHVIEELS
jgi:ABC-type sulfate transport system substrate-binding protein